MARTTYKLGRLPAVRPIGLADLGCYFHHTGGFPAPPATYSTLETLQAVNWQMDGNDSLGDCTIAGSDHVIAAGNATLGTTDPRPALDILEAQYKVLSPDDQGCVMADVLKVWQTTGLFNMPAGTNKIRSYAPFDHRNTTEFRQVIAYTGTAYLGIACPESAQQQFGEQEQTGQLVPWTVVKGSPVEGGHCIVAVGYNDQGVFCISWGAVVLVTWAFLKKYCDEGWAALSQELAEKGADTLGLDDAALQADLAKL